MNINRKLCPTRKFFVRPYLQGGTPLGYHENKDARDLYSFLRLEDTSTDYFLMGPLIALMSFPDLPSFSSQALPLEVLGLEKPQATGAEIIGRGSNSPYLVWQPDTLPSSVVFSLKKADSGSLTVTQGNAVNRIAYSTNPAGDVSFKEDHPEVFHGMSFSLLDFHTTEATLVIPPAYYPYSGVALALSDHPSAISVLHRNGLLEAFGCSEDPLFKVALVASALTLEPLQPQP